MNKHLALIFTVVILLGGCTLRQQKVTDIKNGVIVKSNKQYIKVQYYKDDIVRVIKWPLNGTDKKTSLSVIMDSISDISIDIKYFRDSILMKSGKLIVKIFNKTGIVEFFNNSYQRVLKEKEMALFSPVVYDNDSGYNMQQCFELTPDEGIYGLGQHQYGYFNYRGKTVKLMQANTEAVNPFLISTNHYGIFWDNYSKTIFDDNAERLMVWSDMGDNIDYYLIYGNNMDSIISGYRKLTGDAPMYGKWAYGYWQSKEHYDTQAELMNVAEKYRKLKIPIDNMIQDWDYWNGAANWGGMFLTKHCSLNLKRCATDYIR